jgi:hypothetical protein
MSRITKISRRQRSSEHCTRPWAARAQAQANHRNQSRTAASIGRRAPMPQNCEGDEQPQLLLSGKVAHGGFRARSQ